jgi:hypothetical protein
MPHAIDGITVVTVAASLARACMWPGRPAVCGLPDRGRGSGSVGGVASGMRVASPKMGASLEQARMCT